MNEKGKLNITVIILGIFVISIFSAGFFTLSLRAQNGAMPDAPSMLQEPGGDDTEMPPATGDEEDVYDEDTSEEPAPAPDDEEEFVVEEEILEEEEEAEELILEYLGGGLYDVVPPGQKKGLSHAEQTPHALSSLGITYKEWTESNIGSTTQNLLNVNLPEAMFRKNMVAREYLTPDNIEARIDPLYVTDLIPDAIRPELEGEGIVGTVDQALIDQLIEQRISTIFTYMPIHIIGTMESGPYRSALVSIPMIGYYDIMREGSGHQIPAFGTDRGTYMINFNLRSVSEDEVTIVMSATLVDRIHRRALSSTPPVTRNFYVRRYN